MVQVRKSDVNDAHIIAKMVAKLLSELSGTGVEEQSFTNVAKECINNKLFNAFIAFSENEECIGFISVTESIALYAGGCFGIIQELYVVPEKRSLHIGHELIKTLIDYGIKQKWNRIEVGAPNPLYWQRTIDFYIREGFKEIGPRLKFVL
jgi:GNAT superfamily N-acetyltransferase